MDQKPFSQELYNENDIIAKQSAVSFLEWTKHYTLMIPLEEQEEVFKKYDFVISRTSNLKEIPVEVERKKVWIKSAAWQGWPTIDVPHRKSESKAKLFVMTNKTCDTLAITLMKNIKEASVNTKKTIYTNNELFFNVDLNKFKFYYKTKNGWIQFNT